MNQITIKDAVVISGSPENVLNGVPGDTAYDALAGVLYVKQFSNGPIGWVTSTPPNVTSLYEMTSSTTITGTNPMSAMGFGTGSIAADLAQMSPGDTIQLTSMGPVTVDPNEGTAPLSVVTVVAINEAGTNVQLGTANVSDYALANSGSAMLKAELVYLGNGNFYITIDPSPAGAVIPWTTSLDLTDDTVWTFDMTYTWPNTSPLDTYTPATAAALKITAPPINL